jgi:signal transduction histidine kinase/ActR/RegA family two-component response regulator
LQEYSAKLYEGQVVLERLKGNTSKIAIYEEQWRDGDTLAPGARLGSNKASSYDQFNELILSIRVDALSLNDFGAVVDMKPSLWTAVDDYASSVVRLHRIYADRRIQDAYAYDDSVVAKDKIKVQSVIDDLRSRFREDAQNAREEAGAGTLAVLLFLFCAVIVAGQRLTRSREGAAALDAQARTLEMSERRLAVLIGNVNAVVMVVNQDGHIAYLSQQAVRILGFLPEKLEDILAHCTTEVGQEILRLVDEDQGEIEAILEVRGVDLEFIVSSRSLFADDAVRGQVLVWHDVTLAHQAQRAIERARDTAFELARLKSEFLANMSHEIRTPMNGVLGMADLLFDTELSDLQTEYVETIHTCGNSLMTILNDILDFSKIEAGHLILEHISFSPNSIVEEAASVVKAEAGRKGIELIVKSEPMGEVVGDPTRIRQVLLNLLTNAMKFTETGQVTIGLESVPEADQISRVRFSVTDTGIGIPESRLDAIFNVFTQVDGSTTRLYGGTGLGLTISKQLVEMMGGHLQVASRLGEGSEFWFEVELPQAQASASHEPDSVIGNLRKMYSVNKRPRGERHVLDKPMTVLVVEDNVVNQAVAERLLRKMGCEVQVAKGGQEALDLLETQRFDAIFMDCLMPGMDGFEATRRIRASEHQWLRDVRIIALTASAMEGDMALCIKAGMDDYLPKPINGEMLYHLLNNDWVRDAA